MGSSKSICFLMIDLFLKHTHVHVCSVGCEREHREPKGESRTGYTGVPETTAEPAGLRLSRAPGRRQLGPRHRSGRVPCQGTSPAAQVPLHASGHLRVHPLPHAAGSVVAHGWRFLPTAQRSLHRHPWLPGRKELVLISNH